VADVPIFNDKRGEYYEIEATINGGTTLKVINTGPIFLHNYDYYQPKPSTRIGLLYGVVGQYALNKQTALRFSFQSEWYSDYFKNNNQSGSLVSILAGVTIKI
jgi:hypothetical protein